MTDFQIDVDAEAVFLDGAWYTREDLSRRIKAMLDSGDFNVARPSMALEALTQSLRNIRTMVFRCMPDLSDRVNELARTRNQSIGAIMREALARYVGQPSSSAAAAPPPTEEEVEPEAEAEPDFEEVTGEVTVKKAAPHLPGTTQEDLPKVIIEEQPIVLAGPGALANVGLEPIELTQPKRTAEPKSEDVSSEHRWFKQ